MAWWEILILVVVVAIATPFVITIWHAMFTNMIDNARRRRLNKNLTGTLETLSKRISDSASQADDNYNEIARQEYLKEIERIEKEIKEEKHE